MYTFKLRRSTSARWAAANPVLAPGEPGFETNTGRLKIGDGYKAWNDLDYFVPVDPDAPTDLPGHLEDETPHAVYDDGPDLVILYGNAKV